MIIRANMSLNGNARMISSADASHDTVVDYVFAKKNVDALFLIEICKFGTHIKILVSSDFYNFLFSYAYKICFIKKMTKASG